MQYVLEHRTPWQLCRAVEAVIPADSGPRLVRRPFNHYDPDYTSWYLVPSLELPFFKFGKYHFMWDENVRQEISAGFIVTKGLDPMLKAAYPTKRGRRLLMDDSWAWPAVMEGVRSGRLETGIRTAAARSGEPVTIRICGGYVDDPGLFNPDQDYRKKDDYSLRFDAAADTVTVSAAKRDGACLKFLNKVHSFAELGTAFETLQKEAFLWCDVFLGIAYAVDNAAERQPGAGEADAQRIRYDALEPFAEFVR